MNEMHLPTNMNMSMNTFHHIEICLLQNNKERSILERQILPQN